MGVRHTSLLPRISSSLAQMVRRCIAAGCNSTTKDNVTFYFFPKDVGLRQKWIDQVRRKRDRWAGPKTYSEICSRHFEPDCFEVDSSLYKSLGVGQKRLQLKPGSVPTIFLRQLPDAVPPPPKNQGQIF